MFRFATEGEGEVLPPVDDELLLSGATLTLVSLGEGICLVSLFNQF